MKKYNKAIVIVMVGIMLLTPIATGLLTLMR